MNTGKTMTGHDRLVVRMLAACLAALALYHAATLGWTPAFPTDDDGAYAAAAYQIWQTGRPGVPGYKDVIGMGRDIYVLGHIGAAAQGVFMRLFGVSVVTALLPSFLVGLGALGLVYLLGRELWDARAGLLAALLLGLSGVFFSASHSARPDLLVTLFFLLALWLAVSARSGDPRWRLLLAGLTMGLSGDVHPNGFLLAPLPLIFWFMLWRPGRRELWRATLCYGGGGALGVVWWISRHYLPQPEEFRAQVAMHGLATHGVKIADHGVLGAVRAEMDRYLDWFWRARGHRHLFEGLCVGAGGALLVWRGGREGRALVGLWLGLFLIAAALMSNTFGWYLIFAWPLFALWMAGALTMINKNSRHWQSRYQWIARGAMAMLIAAYLVNLGLWHWKARQDTSLQTRLGELRATVPAGAPVFASAGLWFAFWDRDFTHDPYLPFRALEVKLNPRTGPTGWDVEQRKLGWRYIAAYGNLRREMDPDFPIEQMLEVEPWRERAAEVREAREFSLKRCEVISRLPGLNDTITIFRVKDSAPSIAGEAVVEGQ